MRTASWRRQDGKGGLVALVCAIGIGMAIWLGMDLSKRGQERRAADAADFAKKVVEAKAAKQVETDLRCVKGRDALLAKHAALTKAGKNWDAARAFEDCAVLTNDAQMHELIADSEKAHYLGIVRNTRLPPTERLEALDDLRRDYPAAASAVEPTYRDLQRRAAEYRVAEEKRAEAREKAERRKRGVTIGMTQEDVLQSSWGRPREVNRTTYSWGTKEQWVYEGGYLYFTNGILDAIQN